ncbi:MAG: amino acid adenylation domain-containing protein, partial [Actinomycetota bacterium]
MLGEGAEMSGDNSTPVALGARRDGSYEPSRTQRLIWASQRRHPTAPLANMAERLRIGGEIDADRFVAAVDAVVRQVDVLRSVIEPDGERMTVLSAPPKHTLVIDLPADQIDAWSAERIAEPIDATTCVYDSVLLRHARDDWTWWYDIHHIGIDAWSAPRLAEAVSHAYAYDGPPANADLTPYATSFATAEPVADPDERAERAAAWRADADGVGGHAPLNLYGPRGDRTTAVARCPLPDAAWHERLDDALTSDYRSLSTELSLLTISAMATAITARRLDGRNAVVVGVPVHHRTGRWGSDAIGPMMELYPLTVTFDDDETHRELFARTLRSVMQVLRRARPGESPDTPFDVVLNVSTARWEAFAGLPTQREWIPSGHVEPNHVLRVQVFDTYDPYADTRHRTWQLDLNEGLSVDGSHRALPDHFSAIVGGIIDRPDELAGRVPLLSDDERHALAQLNPAPANRELDLPVHELVRRQLESEPGHIVAEHDGVTITAREFDDRADAVARSLCSQGLQPGQPVGLRMGRSIEVLLAIHGVLRAGGQFVFLDPDDPATRHDTIAADAELFTILDTLPPASGVDVALPTVTLDATAYTLYTSGSTGLPKGVPISHRGLVDYLDFAISSYTDPARPPWVPLHSALVFDLSITSLFLGILTGGRTVVFDREPVEALGAIARDERLTFFKGTPSQLDILTRVAPGPLSIETFVVGGEAFRRPTADRIIEQCAGPVRIFNEYGPTEAVVGCMIHEYDPAIDTGTDVPIGSSAPGTRLVVLDSLGEVAPPGAWGELFVHRPGAATGYLNRPELTVERFGPSPLSETDRIVAGADRAASTDHDLLDGTVWYRTGDRVRVERPGVLVYGGRADDQLKVNGIRLEPAEVEAALVAQPTIDMALVRVWQPTDTATAAEPERCVRCGLGVDVPGVEIDGLGVCSICHQFDEVEPQTRAWFKTPDDLDERQRAARARRTGDYDCLHLLSGGKDSTYALYQLVDRGWKVHALTLDNGFISEGAKENVRRSVADLGITHEFATTDSMNEIFADSLDRYANVCQGCYKTIYTLAVARAEQLGIPTIVTGLSRGQFFETRLVPHQFEAGRFDPDEIDATVLEARRVYHETQDAVTKLLPEQRVFDDGTVLERIEFVDFYRYVDVPLAELYDYLDRRAPWVRPDDTGRSTNCLINVAGIRVHQRERGYHNYAEPYSWDVRLGHKTRDEALEELDDEIDEAEVADLLARVGYEPKTSGVLTAWYQTTDGLDLDPDDLRRALRDHLPAHAIPAAFVRVDEVPLAASAKADPSLLPAPTRFHRQGGERVAPETPTEERLASIWADVLGLETVGVTDDFFDLGGASLDALAVVAFIDDQFETDLSDAAVFRARTVRELAEVVDGYDAEPNDRAALDSMTTGPLPLSAGEEYMLFEYRTNPDDTRYNVTRLYTLDATTAPIDVSMLEAAIRDVVMHHETLHTRFDADRTPMSRDDAVRVVDLGQMTSSALEERAAAIQREPYDLDAGPLVRAHIADLGNGRIGLLLGMHHIVVGAGTFDAFWRQITTRIAGDDLPALPTTYARHTLAQRRLHERNDTSARFWAELLDASTPAPRRTAVDGPEADGYLVAASDVTTSQLAATGPTAFATALAAAGTVFAAFAGTTEVQVGITASTNDRPDTADLIGYYVNPIAVPVRVEPADRFVDTVERAAATMASVLPHRTYPYAWVIRDARTAGRPVPDVSVMLAYDRIEAPTYPGAIADQRILHSGSSVVDATFFVQERGDSIQLGLEYRGSVIGAEMAQRMLEAFGDVLASGVRTPSATAGELTAGHRPRDLRGPTLPDAPLVLERLVGHAEATPAATAVVDARGASLDYRAFAAAIETTAAAIADGGRPRRVGVAVRRSVDLVVALYAAQAAGGAAVPLDPTLPDGRLRSIADAAGLDVVVTDDPERLGSLAPRVVAAERNADDADIATSALRDRVADITVDDDSYVIFTSGSTGVPRGVAVTHGNLAASTAAREVWFDANPRRFLVTSSPGFDSSVVGLYWPIATGGAVVVPSDADVRDVDRIAGVIDRLDVSHTLMVPSLASALLDRAPQAITDLDVSIVAGEACPAALVERYAALAPDVALVNEYGPTEATVWSTAHRLVAGDDPVPIGAPIPGATARVAGSDGLPVPVGVAGELWIAGPGVTAGYLGDDAATAERFIETDGHRWYRTGDLVRAVDDVLYFLGRLDDQLNVGGVRVEPGEIERELEAFDEVTAAVVVAVGEPRQLVAHVLTDTAVDEAAYRTRLRDVLPAGSIPRRFIAQPSLPQTANGKVDRGAAQRLPLPDPAAGELGATVEIDSPLAEAVYRAWRETFPGDVIAADSDFFALGGDSLTAVALAARLDDELDEQVPIAVLVGAPSPAGMIRVLESELRGEIPPAERITEVQLRKGTPTGPVIVMPTAWSEVFGYQGLAEALPEGIEVVVLGYEWLLDPDLLLTVPELAQAMRDAVEWERFEGRHVLLAGWSFAGSVAVEIARLLRADGHLIDEVVLLDTYFPNLEILSNANTIRNKWWSYKGLLRPGGMEELQQERDRWRRLRTSKAYITPRQKVKNAITWMVGPNVLELMLRPTRLVRPKVRRKVAAAKAAEAAALARGDVLPTDERALERSAPTTEPAATAADFDADMLEIPDIPDVPDIVPEGARVVVEIPWQAKLHAPIAAGVPTTYFRATESNPRFTSDAWRRVVPDLDEVVFKGRHKGFNGFLRKDKVGAVADEL